MTGSDWGQFAFLVPVTATIVGWFVVARQAERREFRKEVREQIKEFRDSSDRVRDLSTAYWSSVTRESAAKAVSLKAEMKRFSRLAQSIASTGLDVDPSEMIAEVRTLATGGDFESKRRKVTPEDHNRVLDITGALEDLLTSVDTAFYREFRPVRSSKLWRWLPLGGALLLRSD